MGAHAAPPNAAPAARPAGCTLPPPLAGPLCGLLKVAEVRRLAADLGLSCITAHKADATQVVASAPASASASETILQAAQQKAPEARAGAAATAAAAPWDGRGGGGSAGGAAQPGPALVFEAGSFDCVMLDPPCSALGLRPRLVHAWTLPQVRHGGGGGVAMRTPGQQVHAHFIRRPPAACLRRTHTRTHASKQARARARAHTHTNTQTRHGGCPCLPPCARPQLRALASYQRALLHSAVALLRPGGRLLYCTCTVNPDENEANVAWALDRCGRPPASSSAVCAPKCSAVLPPRFMDVDAAGGNADGWVGHMSLARPPFTPTCPPPPTPTCLNLPRPDPTPTPTPRAQGLAWSCCRPCPAWAWRAWWGRTPSRARVG